MALNSHHHQLEMPSLLTLDCNTDIVNTLHRTQMGITGTDGVLLLTPK